MKITGKKILICPLDWGIGHATRMVAYARQLEEGGNSIVVAGSHRVLDVFFKELPHVARYHLPDVNVSYSKTNHIVLKLVFRMPLFLYSLWRQHFLLKKLLSQVDVDLVISDNRPTLWSRNVCSYYVTHQLSLKLPKAWKWAEGLASFIHQSFIRQFDACLVPDVQGSDSLSGELSIANNKYIDIHYIGWLSRFNNDDTMEAKGDYILLVLSGVEPTRSQLKDEIVARYRNTFEQLIIAGDYNTETVGNVTSLTYVCAEELKPLILGAKHIVCRSGYSMLMDLKVLDCEAELIATPGQPEQEYLAILHSR